MRSPIIAISVLAATFSPILAMPTPPGENAISRPRITEVQNKATAPLNVRRQLDLFMLPGTGAHRDNALPGADLLKDPATQADAKPITKPSTNFDTSKDLDSEDPASDVADDESFATDDIPNTPAPGNVAAAAPPIEPAEPASSYAASNPAPVTVPATKGLNKRPGDASSAGGKPKAA